MVAVFCSFVQHLPVSAVCAVLTMFSDMLLHSAVSAGHWHWDRYGALIAATPSLTSCDVKISGFPSGWDVVALPGPTAPLATEPFRLRHASAIAASRCIHTKRCHAHPTSAKLLAARGATQDCTPTSRRALTGQLECPLSLQEAPQRTGPPSVRFLPPWELCAHGPDGPLKVPFGFGPEPEEEVSE